MTRKWMLLAAGVAAAVSAGSAGAVTMPYQAQSFIVGQTSTANSTAGGDPRYFATAPRYSGVVSLIMQEAGGSFICTGSLLADRRSILTAGHCVSGGAGTANPIRTTAYFYNGTNPDAVPSSAASGSTARVVEQYFVNSGYTGEVIDQNDIAVLRLSEEAPEWALSYDLFTDDLTGREFNVAGFGGRSTAGGSVGQNVGTGVRRQGDNTFDYRIGDSAFNGGFVDALREPGDRAQIEGVYLADFDNGTATNNTGCRVAQALGATGDRFCGTGLGAREVSIAGGDSGSASFIDGRIATVTSFGLSFGTGFGDVDARLNSSWGEFGGYVPVGLHTDFIRNSMLPTAVAVPEPATWAMMIAGVGLVGGSLRRRRVSTKVSFA